MNGNASGVSRAGASSIPVVGATNETSPRSLRVPVAARAATDVWCRDVFFVLRGGVPEKQTRPPTAVARVNARAGGPNDAHWKALCAGEPGIEPLLMTTKDYYALC